MKPLAETLIIMPSILKAVEIVDNIVKRRYELVLDIKISWFINLKNLYSLQFSVMIQLMCHIDVSY